MFEFFFNYTTCMADTPYQEDFKITTSSSLSDTRKATLKLSPTGDIVLCEGHEKLTTQLLRALVNEQTKIKGLMNKKGVRYTHIETLVNLIIRNMRQNQLDEVNRYDPSLTGFAIWRRSAGTDENYTRISGKAVTWKFVDTGLTNGVTYQYAITKIYKSVFETAFLETMLITPSQLASNYTIITGKTVCALNSNQRVTFYVDFNRKFKGSELINKIKKISTYRPDSDPRKMVVQVTVEDLTGNLVSLSSDSVKPIGQ